MKGLLDRIKATAQCSLGPVWLCNSIVSISRQHQQPWTHHLCWPYKDNCSLLWFDNCFFALLCLFLIGTASCTQNSSIYASISGRRLKIFQVGLCYMTSASISTCLTPMWYILLCHWHTDLRARISLILYASHSALLIGKIPIAMLGFHVSNWLTAAMMQFFLFPMVLANTQGALFYDLLLFFKTCVAAMSLQ